MNMPFFFNKDPRSQKVATTEQLISMFVAYRVNTLQLRTMGGGGKSTI